MRTPMGKDELGEILRRLRNGASALGKIDIEPFKTEILAWVLKQVPEKHNKQAVYGCWVDGFNDAVDEMKRRMG